MERQGPLARDNFIEEPSGYHINGVNRLVLHGAQDDTMRRYIIRVIEFLKWAKLRGARFDTATEIDMWLADYMEEAFYARSKPLDFGSSTFFGFLAFFPEYKMKLDRAHRAFHSWRALQVQNEGFAIPEEAVMLIVKHFEDHGHAEAALITETSMDVYFRTHEWSQLRAEDIYYDGNLVGLQLGVSARGERVKTGHDQGVVLDSPYLRDKFAMIKKSKHASQPVFQISTDSFKKLWEKAKTDLKLSWIGPEHGLRHAGAARDIELSVRTLEQVRRRGRWKSLESVQRYTKTWLLIKARSQMTACQIAEGRQHAATRPLRGIQG